MLLNLSKLSSCNKSVKVKIDDASNLVEISTVDKNGDCDVVFLTKEQIAAIYESLTR
jgi:hypothetical protein